MADSGCDALEDLELEMELPFYWILHLSAVWFIITYSGMVSPAALNFTQLVHSICPPAPPVFALLEICLSFDLLDRLLLDALDALDPFSLAAYACHLLPESWLDRA
jgi:hypothetical protein